MAAIEIELSDCINVGQGIGIWWYDVVYIRGTLEHGSMGNRSRGQLL